MLIEYKLGSLEAKLGAKIASVTSGHNVTCFDYEVMISPLFRWPNSLCHYKMISSPARNLSEIKGYDCLIPDTDHFTDRN